MHFSKANVNLHTRVLHDAIRACLCILGVSFVYLGADSCNFRESGDTREILDFLIFCPNNLYGKLFSKIAFKGSTAFYFFKIDKSLKIAILASDHLLN